MEVFSELPYKVLWKFEDEDLPNKPENIKIRKWIPQQDVLGHPNIKLFITQSGLQSTEEAIFNQVPLLAMPFIADQHFNSKRIVELGIGLKLDFGTLEKNKFKGAVLEIVKNPKYKNKIKEISELITDRPMTGLDRAVWWTEYVLRHTGAPYFRPTVVNMSWYEYLLLDIFLFFIVIFATAIFVLFTIVRYVLRYINISKCIASRKKLNKND